MLRDSEEICLFKVKFWSSMTPSILMVCENGLGYTDTAIVGDAGANQNRFRFTAVGMV